MSQFASQKILPLVLMFLGMTGLQGCTSFHNFKAPWFDDKLNVKESDKNPVVRLLAIWQPGEGMGLDNLSTRGFVGQVMFFTAEKPVPAAVEGNVRIYVFDDQGTEEEQAKPIHQFDFPDGAWKAMQQKSDIGMTYRVFIPYTRKGNQLSNCTLRIKYQPKHGRAIYSEIVNVTLPGPKKALDEKISTEEQQASKKTRKKKAEAKDSEGDEELAEDFEVVQTTHRVSKPKKAKGIPLTEEERERIYAEVKANMPAEVAKPKPAEHLLKGKTQSHALAEEGDDAEAKAAPAKRSGHLLDQSDADDSEGTRDEATMRNAVTMRDKATRVRRGGWDTSARGSRSEEESADEGDAPKKRTNLRVSSIPVTMDE